MTDRIGFRTIETQGPRIVLNGEPIFLRGVSIHEESPFRPGRAWSEADARTLLGWAVELGCNFVRLAHYPHNETMVRVAEELGLLVWAEIPVYWKIAWANPPTLACAKSQLEELIRRDRNRCAVVLWSLSNESPASEERLAFLAALAQHARALDPTRLLTSALFARLDGETDTMVIDDPIGEHLDVMGCNQYLGWYYSAPEKMERISWSSPYDKPLVMSEFGAGAVAGRLGADEDEVFGERYQARVYRHQIEMQSRIAFLGRVLALDPEGLPYTQARAARHPGRLEPQGTGLRPRPEEARLRRHARLVPGARRTGVTRDRSRHRSLLRFGAQTEVVASRYSRVLLSRLSGLQTELLHQEGQPFGVLGDLDVLVGWPSRGRRSPRCGPGWACRRCWPLAGVRRTCARARPGSAGPYRRRR